MVRLSIIAAAAALLTGGAAAAQDCDPGKPGTDLTGAEAQAVYDCIAGRLQAGYAAGPKRWIPDGLVDAYPGWTRASAFPAAPGFHGGRFLVTWVNETGAAEYVKYAEAPQIPAGTALAKESFAVNDAGTVVPGPLFLMQKVAAGASPETADWHYMMVAPDGAPVAVDVIAACSDCHMGNFGHQGGLGYPVPEARLAE